MQAIDDSLARTFDLESTDRGEVRTSYIGELAPRPVQTDTAAAQLVRVFLDAGVDTYFGVPGGPISPLFDAIIRTPGARLIESRHETNAAFAAVGYWRTTGKIPVVAVTAGPGATNAVTGIVSAHLERVPMIVICGDVAWATHGGKLLQDTGPEGIGIEKMLSHVVRFTARAASSRSAATQGLAALAAASNPTNPGPALLVLPIDRGNTQTAPSRIVQNTWIPQTSIDPKLLREVRAILSKARRPLLILGAGCRGHLPAIRQLVNALDIPFMTTPQAKGIVSENHRNSLRNGGLAASWWARKYTERGVDAALALGTDLDDCAVGPTPPISPTGKLIHVDLDASVFNRNYPTELSVVADLGPFSRALVSLLKKLPLDSDRGHTTLREVRTYSPFDQADFADDSASMIAPHRVIADLQRAATADTRFVTDIGEHMLFGLHYLTAEKADRFTIHLGLGSMGSGICSAIGMAIGDPKRPVICICGDGGMQMAGSEVLVAVKNEAPVIYAVFNDARYNMVYHGFKDVFGREAAWDAPRMDFVEWGQSMGAHALRISHPGEINARLLSDLAKQGGPVILDIRHDPSVRLRGAGRNESLRRMSMT